MLGRILDKYYNNGEDKDPLAASLKALIFGDITGVNCTLVSKALKLLNYTVLRISVLEMHPPSFVFSCTILSRRERGEVIAPGSNSRCTHEMSHM